ncbi:MAG: phage tail spike protein [Anaerovoracaceae bacterium]|jgi:hypothetical protein
MYKVYLDGELIYTPGDELKSIMCPKIELADNKSGSFEFQMPITSSVYNKVHELTSVVHVTKDGEDVFRGRPISVTRDFTNMKTVVCEGELGYLLDTIQPPKEFHDYTVRQFLTHLLNEHNRQAEMPLNIGVTFSPKCSGESGSWDYISIYYKKGDSYYAAVQKKNANLIAGQTFAIPSLDFYIYWHTDSSVNNGYGFSIDDISVTGLAAETGTKSSLPSYEVVETKDYKTIESTHNPYNNNTNQLWHYTHTLTSKDKEKLNPKKFTVGMTTVNDPNDSLYRYTNWETTLDDINDKLVSRLGGHIRVRHVGSTRYLDYLEDYDNTNTQVIEFGENLLDYTEDMDASDVATRIIPLGARLEESGIDALESYTTIESVNDRVPYAESASAIGQFGIVTRTVSFDDVTVPQNLKEKAQQYLSDVQFENLSLTCKAIDLNMVDGSVERIKLGDSIRVISKPHGMDRYFPVTALTIRLDKPEDNTITLGTSIKAGISERSTSQNADVIKRINSLTPLSKTLQMAKENATALITAATTGHVVTRPNEILIMDTDKVETAKKVWRWNLNGLGYSKTGYNGSYGTAITMDGSIVADYITTGTLNADLIKAGILKDKNGNMTWNMSTGAITAKKLSIDSTNFTLTQSGYLTAKNATLEGTVTAESGDRKVIMGSGYLRIFYDGKEVGLIGGNGYAKDATKVGLNFDLEYTGNYMTWAAQPSSGANYDMKWTYARSSFGNFSGGMLNAGCDIDMHNWKLRNVSWPDGGITGTCNFVRIISMSSDGTVSKWSTGNKLQFKNGILIAGTFS